ncbi:MAG TPA: TerC/Alx family metal homeostasis membrane protein [Burkholderiales bacterium]|nr:TerC/Alx family metal homeostasis membrane protein [Burkholderiales bacterium]
MTTEWIVFVALVAGALALDLTVSRKSDTKSAAVWSAAWIGLGLAFGGWIALRQGGEAGVNYLTAYLLEKSLSVDNLFVFILIFSLTGIPAGLQRRALFWGIFGALVMRAVLIALGVELLERFHWAIYPLAALLAYAAYRMLRGEEKQARFVEQQCALCESWLARVIPIEPRLHGARFLVRINGRLMATPLLVALTVIETTDLLFAVDSIPAVLAVTRDPFLVYSSNVFALLGLRSLYFLLAGVIRKLRFVRIGLAVMLLLAAAKLALGDVYHVPPLVSLGAIVVIMLASVIASLLFPKREEAAPVKPACTHLNQVADAAPKTDGCEECLQQGERWVHLRLCLTCGHVGCCDSSPNKHATAHFRATGHPIVRSLEPRERWRWCYVDKTMLD